MINTPNLSGGMILIVQFFEEHRLSFCINSSNIWPQQKQYQRTKGLPPPVHITNPLTQANSLSPLFLFLCVCTSPPLFSFFGQCHDVPSARCGVEKKPPCTKLPLVNTHMSFLVLQCSRFAFDTNPPKKEIKVQPLRWAQLTKMWMWMLHNPSGYLSLPAPRTTHFKLKRLVYLHLHEKKNCNVLCSQMSSCLNSKSCFLSNSENFFGTQRGEWKILVSTGYRLVTAGQWKPNGYEP